MPEVFSDRVRYPLNTPIVGKPATALTMSPKRQTPDPLKEREFVRRYQQFGTILEVRKRVSPQRIFANERSPWEQELADKRHSGFWNRLGPARQSKLSGCRMVNRSGPRRPSLDMPLPGSPVQGYLGQDGHLNSACTVPSSWRRGDAGVARGTGLT